MRHALFGLLLLPLAALAAQAPTTFDPAEFEQRFHAADTGNKGKLSRQEAYAEFPRMPQYFDQIDTNRDGYITLIEVEKAMQRSVDAAISAGRIGKRYPGALGASTENGVAANGDDEAVAGFSSKTEARRHYRYEYYESLAGSQEQAPPAIEPAFTTAPAQLKKNF